MALYQWQGQKDLNPRHAVLELHTVFFTMCYNDLLNHLNILDISTIFSAYTKNSSCINQPQKIKSVRKMLEKALHQKKETAEKSAVFLYAWQKVKWVQGAESQCVAETIPLYSAAIMNAP